MLESITKKLGKFELSLQKSIFVKTFISKFNEYTSTISEHLDVYSKKCYVKGKLAIKYINGKNRKRIFIEKLMDSFEEEHNILFSMIEFKEVKDRNEKYMKHKRNISTLIRAKRRFVKLNDVEECKDFLSEYIFNKRLSQKYNYN